MWRHPKGNLLEVVELQAVQVETITATFMFIDVYAVERPPQAPNSLCTAGVHWARFDRNRRINRGLKKGLSGFQKVCDKA